MTRLQVKVSALVIAIVIASSNCCDFSLGQIEIEEVCPLGFSSGSAVFSEGKLLIGTGVYDSGTNVDSGLLLCLNETGDLLWTSRHQRLPERINDIPGAGIRTVPLVDGDRVYFYSNRGEVVCADMVGFADSSNAGPFLLESDTDPKSVDIVWSLDLPEKLGVFKRDAGDVGNPLPSVILHNDVLYCVTGHGRTLAGNPDDDIPALIAVNRETGEIIWGNNAPAGNVVYGQWGTPTIVTSPGEKDRIVYPGGDGKLHMVAMEGGGTIWSADLNERREVGGVNQTTGVCSGTPLQNKDLVIAGVGIDVESTILMSPSIVAFDAKSGEQRWAFHDDRFDSCLGSVVSNVDKTVVFAVATNGFVVALDATNGRLLAWRLLGEMAAIFSSPVINNELVYVASTSRVSVFSANEELSEIDVVEIGQVISATPTITTDRVYVPTSTFLYSFPVVDDEAREQTKEQTKVSSTENRE